MRYPAAIMITNNLEQYELLLKEGIGEQVLGRCASYFALVQLPNPQFPILSPQALLPRC